MNRYDKIRFFSVMMIVMMLGVAGCMEKDPYPMPKATFEVTTVSPEVNVPVKFENLSRNAAIYEWDFGDGSPKSIDTAPEHTYTEPGDYIVKLTSITEDEQVSEVSKVVKVGERYLVGMYLINVNMMDGNDQPWDKDGSGPDVLMQFGPVGTGEEIPTDQIEGFFIDSLNVGQFTTPLGITTDDLLTENYKLENQEYFLLLEEVDTVNNEPKYNTMIELQFNPIFFEGESITEVKREGGTGDLTIPFIVFDEYQFLLSFEIK